MNFTSGYKILTLENLIQHSISWTH